MVWRNVLVGTDGSPTASKAVAKAAELAEQVRAHLVVAYVGTPEEGRPVLDAVLQEHPGADVRLLGGDPADALLGLADAEAIDLVIVGSKGMTGAARFLLGSVPNKISHRATADVLIVRTT